MAFIQNTWVYSWSAKNALIMDCFHLNHVVESLQEKENNTLHGHFQSFFFYECQLHVSRLFAKGVNVEYTVDKLF